MCIYLIFMDPCIIGWLSRNNQQFPLRLDYGRSPHAYVNQRLQIQLELLIMSGIPLETCSAFNKRWINKFYYKVASCWLFLMSHVDLYFCCLKALQFVNWRFFLMTPIQGNRTKFVTCIGHNKIFNKSKIFMFFLSQNISYNMNIGTIVT